MPSYQDNPICPLCNKEISADHRAQFSNDLKDLVHVDCLRDHMEKQQADSAADSEAMQREQRAKFTRQLRDVKFLDADHTIVDATDYDLFGRAIKVRINLPAQRVIQINGKSCNITVKQHQKNRVDVSVATGPTVEDKIHLHALGISWDAEDQTKLPERQEDKLLAITFPEREQKLTS